MLAELKRLLADDLLENLTTMPLDRLRGLRVESSRVEGDVSFARRVAQGRLDIVGHEVGRRSNGSEAEPTDMSALLFDMPNILTDDPSPASGSGVARSAPILEPGAVAIDMIEKLDGFASPSTLSSIDAVSQGDLADLFDELRTFEVELSNLRRQLHDRIDTMQDEIARRYREGEASVDALLS